MRQFVRAGAESSHGLERRLHCWYSHADADAYAFTGHAGSTGAAMSLDEPISRLKFFHQKAEKLRRLSCTQSVLTQPPAVTATFLLEPPSTEIQTTTPHEESIDAFLYTFRFFIMGNEETSCRRMPGMYEQLPITEEKKPQLRSGRDKLNHWLDSPTYFQVDDEARTNRHIMETFINGGLGHANDKKRVKEYEMWAAMPIHLFLKVEFIYIIAKIFGLLATFVTLSESLVRSPREHFPSVPAVSPCRSASACRTAPCSWMHCCDAKGTAPYDLHGTRG